MNNLFTKINKENLLDDDCVKLEYVTMIKSIAKSSFGRQEEHIDKIEHAIYREGNFYSVIDNIEINTDIEYPHIRIDYYLHNYKFISKEDSWYIEGTEVYPDIENYGSNQDGASIFQGLTYKENFNEMEGTGPVWDGETCPFDEFIITVRINQIRNRKLNRILK